VLTGWWCPGRSVLIQLVPHPEGVLYLIAGGTGGGAISSDVIPIFSFLTTRTNYDLLHCF
jgi:hypothetical protein